MLCAHAIVAGEADDPSGGNAERAKIAVARERAFAFRLRKDGLDCRIYARATSDPRDDLTCLLDLRFRELEGRSVGASILAGNMQLFLPDLCQIHIACQSADLVQSRLTKIVSRHGL